MRSHNYYLYLSFNWLVILGCLLLTKKTLYFAPVAFFMISNRQFANYLAGHDGIHGHINNHPGFNDLLTRIFCLGPVFVSLLSYKEKHLLHHEFLGTSIDPDKKLYDFYPVAKKQYWQKLAVHFFSLNMVRDFLIYFTPFFELNKKQFYRSEKIFDCFFYLFIACLFSTGFILFFGMNFFLGLWIGPLLLLMPYYYFVNALQHGLIYEREGEDASRNIEGNWILMEILLPCATNFHGVHHLYPQVPFYNLRKVFIKKNLTAVSYSTALKELVK